MLLMMGTHFCTKVNTHSYGYKQKVNKEEDR